MSLPARLTIRYDPLDGLVDMGTGLGLTMQFTVRGSCFFFHGLACEGRQNLGTDFTGAIDGYEVPDGTFTEWLRDRIADLGGVLA